MIRLFILPTLTLAIAFVYGAYDIPPEFEPPANLTERSYPAHLTGTFTGGFEEETCRSCHFDYDLNPDNGDLSLSGIPEKVPAGETIKIEATVEREKLGAAGFQLSARYEDGSQAGRFDIKENDRIMFSEAVPDSLQYVQHTNEGTIPSGENKSSWMVFWQAPESQGGTVVFNIAANAANGDQSEFGDFIYVDEVKVRF